MGDDRRDFDLIRTKKRYPNGTEEETAKTENLLETIFIIVGDIIKSIFSKKNK